jgi:hypothetical protein
VDDQVKLVNQIGFDQGADELPSGVHDSGISTCWHFGSCSHNQSVPELDNLQLRYRLAK